MHLPPIQMSTQVDTVNIGPYALLLEIASNFDDLLDYYAEHHPNATDLIPYYAHLWDSASALCTYLLAHPKLAKGKQVLELGCGLGLPSLLAAKLGATQVTATDFHPDVEAFIGRNIAHNRLEGCVSYALYDWQASSSAPPTPTPPELILASDVLYEAATVPAFTDRAAALCRNGATLLLADPGRTKLQQAVAALETEGISADLEIVQDIFILRMKY